MTILVSNLSFMTTTNHLFDLFVKFGLIDSIEIIRANINGHSSGIGLVRMNISSGKVAIQELNEIKFMNFYINVSEVPM